MRQALIELGAGENTEFLGTLLDEGTKGVDEILAEEDPGVTTEDA